MSERDNTVSSLLVPLQQRPLLLPAACVVEVIDFVRPQNSFPEIDWVLGATRWRGLDIQVVSFELLGQSQFTEFSATNRIMIVRRTTEACSEPFYGLVTQGMPKPVELHPDDLKLRETSHTPSEKMQVLFRDLPTTLPDLAFLEERLSEVLQPEPS